MKQRILAIVLAFVLVASLSAVCVYAADDDNTETGGGFLASVRDTMNNANADSDADGSSASGKKQETFKIIFWMSECLLSMA